METSLSPGGPGGSPVLDFSSRERTVSMSPPQMVVNTVGAVGLRSLSPGEREGSLRNFDFTGKVLEERVDGTAGALREAVMRPLPEGSPSRVRLLEAEDAEVDEKLRKSIAESNAKLTSHAEGLCRDNLNSHFKMLGLRNAVNLVPKLMTENKHLKEEIVRARSAKPEDVQRDLVRIDETKKTLLEDQANRTAEENTAKERLKDALEALRNGGFPDTDLISFVTAALDSAIGVVFRTEDHRTQIEADLALEKTQTDALREKITSQNEQNQIMMCKIDKLLKVNTELEEQREDATAHAATSEDAVTSYKAEVKTLYAQLADDQKTLETTRLERDGLRDTLQTVKDNIKASRSADADEMDRVRSRYKTQLEDLEDDRKKTVKILTDRVDEERTLARELEKKLREAEAESLEAKGTAQHAEIEKTHSNKEVTRHAATITRQETQLEQVEKKLTEAKDTASDLKDEIRELKQLLTASIETAEGDRKINSQLRETNENLSEQLKTVETQAEDAALHLVEAELQATKHEAALRDITQQAREAEEARFVAAESLEEMGRKSAEMEEAYHTAIEGAKKEREELEDEKDKCLAEAMERLEIVNTLREERSGMVEELEGKTVALERLEGAEEKLAEAERMKEEAEELRGRAEKKIAASEQAALRIEEFGKEFEKKVVEEHEVRLEVKEEENAALQKTIAEEQARSERVESRIAQCLEQLKTVEGQRVEEAKIYQEKQAAHYRAKIEAEQKAKDLHLKLQDTRDDGRYAKKNAKSVGWILAGRGALLRDLHKLHMYIQDQQAVPGAAKELSTHIMTTHLFECERRHLGMAPSEAPPDRESPPRAPSPRQSWRLFNHSPAARPQDPPMPPPDHYQPTAGKRPRAPPNPNSVTSPPSLKSLDYW